MASVGFSLVGVVFERVYDYVYYNNNNVSHLAPQHIPHSLTLQVGLQSAIKIAIMI